MIQCPLQWIRRLARAAPHTLRWGVQPLPKPSIGTRRTLCFISAREMRDFTAPKKFHYRDTEHTEAEHIEGSTAAPLRPAPLTLRPNGAQGCSHGWSAARVLAGAAQPVDSVNHPGPPRQGRRKFTPADNRPTCARIQPTRQPLSLMQPPQRACRPCVHDTSAPLPARKRTARRDRRAFRMP